RDISIFHLFPYTTLFRSLYFHFRSAALSLMVFSGVLVAFAGGFILIGWYGNPHFLDFDFFGKNMRDIFQIREVHLSVAVWVGFRSEEHTSELQSRENLVC